VQKELMSIPDMGDGDEGAFAKEQKMIANMKKCVLMVAGAAVQKLMTDLTNQQEIIMNIADMAIETFVSESLLLRVMKNADRKGGEAIKTENAMMQCYLNDAMDKIAKCGKEAINAFASGDEQRMMIMGLKRFTKADPLNSKDARRLIANKFIEDGRYSL
jgi:Acyl-CoA dehydrogenase, C-terminal domain